MLKSRRLAWSAIAALCALSAAVEVSATLANPVMWILVHHSLKMARIDPIVSPGKVSSHVHSLVGANGVSATTTTAEALESASTCTTSGLSSDMSAYWAPSLYSFNADNSTFTPRPLDYVNTYYLARGNVPITAFPRGMQLLAGNATRMGPGPTKQADNTVSFVCLNYAQGSSQHPTLPPGPCPQGLRTQVLFPSCWNGKDLVSADHSHVVYPLGDNADNGACPDTHAVRLPTLFYEFVYGVDSQDNTDNSTWVLGNGDAIGYSFHADFIAAWNETVLQEALDTCGGNLFNNLESCPPLNATLARPEAQKCSASSSEATTGSIASLPGCNVVWNGPHAGKGLTEGCDPSKVMLKPANWPAASSSSTSTTSASATSSSTTVSASSTSTATSPASQATNVAGAVRPGAGKPSNSQSKPKSTPRPKPQPKPVPRPQPHKAPARQPHKKPLSVQVQSILNAARKKKEEALRREKLKKKQALVRAKEARKQH